jgi:hypothetical protein
MGKSHSQPFLKTVINSCKINNYHFPSRQGQNILMKSNQLLPKLISKKAPESLSKKIKLKRSAILQRIEE